MGQTIPKQHPAVVLRSRYTQLRVLLAITTIAVIALAVAVVILAGTDGPGASATSTTAGNGTSARTEFGLPSHASEHGGAPVPDLRVAPLPNGQRYDGGPEEGSRGPVR
jgi:hypothetical protein